ncbi:MAG TPA: membrane protein insertase YidC [Chthoniobacterales bacterium]|nr:membrane protein insertase YidC [Chthoniobacterales bacterium]
MDRTAWIAVTLCVIGLVAWEWWIAKHTPPRPAVAVASPTPSSTLVEPGATPATPLFSPAPVAASTAAPSPTIPPSEVRVEKLQNADVELDLTNAGGGIAKAVLHNYKAEADAPVTLNSRTSMPIGAIVDNPAAPGLQKYEVDRTGDAVQFVCQAPEEVTIRKKFFFPKSNEVRDNFIAELDLDFVNGGAKPFANAGYFVALGSAAPIHPRDYSYYTRLVWCIDGKAKGIDVNWFGASGGFLGIGQRPPQSVYQQPTPNADWAAVSDQFFTTLIAPLNSKAEGVWARRIDIAPEQKVYALEGALKMPALQIAAGKTYSARFQIYAGPKIYHRLAQLNHNEAEVMDFGIFKIVSQFLLNFMNLLHGLLWHSYAAAILALTTIIRIVLWPLQTKANRSMRQTAALGPKMQELREKYKDDPTKMNQEVMKLYKEYGINPVGGCLPMFIQIPIFFGLYKMLSQAVELRNAKFLWVRDLSQPDTVAHLPVLGWPINPIPLCMAATQIWLMQMTPKTGDPTQRRIMMFTPLIFLFICYNFAAALALYYTTQNLFSILQFYLNKRQPMPALEKVAKRKAR